MPMCKMTAALREGYATDYQWYLCTRVAMYPGHIQCKKYKKKQTKKAQTFPPPTMRLVLASLIPRPCIYHTGNGSKY